MVSPHKIKFNNIESIALPLDLIIEVAFDGDNGETSTYLNREAVVSETYDGRYKRVHGYKYSESFSPKFTFMKKGFADFTMDEVRLVLKWLTSTSQTAVLDVYYTHDDTVKAVDWSAIGGWTEISTYKLANNRTVGIVATFEAVTPFAMSDIYTATKTITSTDNKITIDIDTDDNKPIYPRVTIQANNTNIKFTNKHTDFFNVSKSYNSLALTNNTSGEKVIVDGANKIILSSNTKRIFGDDFNWVWLELYDGKNEITIEGNCTVTLEWREVRKVGEY
jgi:hypothetical protein